MDIRLVRSRRGLMRLVAILGLGTLSLIGSGARAQEGTPEPPPIPCSGVLGVGITGDACLILIHASPDAPSVDILIDDEIVAENLPFGETAGWMTLPAGEHHLQVVPTGQLVDVAVIDATLDLEADLAYEVAATGTIDVIQAGVYPVDLSISEDDANAALRIVNASSDAPAIDVAAGGQTLAENLAYPENSEYLIVPAGAHDLEVRPTGTTDGALLEEPGMELAAGNAYSLFAIGSVEGGTFTLLPIVAGTAMAGAEATPMATPVGAPAATPVG
jgi:hypothetical protein